MGLLESAINQPQSGRIEQVDMQRAKRILIVDDHPINVEILKEFLEDDYELAVAMSGEEGLHTAVDFIPDFILLDISLPGMDGYETCRRMKAEPRLHHAVIMMVSAKAMPSEREQGYLAGADVYLTKPFDRKTLLAELCCQ